MIRYGQVSNKPWPMWITLRQDSVSIIMVTEQGSVECSQSDSLGQKSTASFIKIHKTNQFLNKKMFIPNMYNYLQNQSLSLSHKSALNKLWKAENKMNYTTLAQAVVDFWVAVPCSTLAVPSFWRNIVPPSLGLSSVLKVEEHVPQKFQHTAKMQHSTITKISPSIFTLLWKPQILQY